ncbi:DNA-3-methyladenine glycosylase [Corynebacterium sp. CCM 9185]|uniref:Putative 3-methyladenine DNA glycosylase n=1 Tax=Corynebacterium marambiense TaxID=2765364 RepID=A0ABS0VSL6_9CORY|nr:DNA-3-methyladenine glycosylase [Corynebacterium marambiense]MBI8999767.1 DNA-3-methyladenine glycosylase [Corynebacterium marambiense]MCK7662607.1 DNA-3-methyladenine glycosylase [Corynebacterium marambiense]MCX7543615.1 DNA-3-methyladenine glycosylase [Corynebacterium marambiense]
MIDFAQPADHVAPLLLGCTLSHAGVTIRLTEVEAYLGEQDDASHARRGKTPRNAAMFGPPGRMYVYISYGIHHAGNIVCHPPGGSGGILLRAGEVVDGHDTARARRGPTIPDARLAQGPGNLGRALALHVDHNHSPVLHSGTDGFVLKDRDHEPHWTTGPRIGITRNADAPLRFYLPGEPTVTSPRGRARR